MKHTPSEIIKAARKNKSVTQAVIADKLGMSLRQYQKIEDGAFPKYKSEIIKGIDDILGTNAYELIYDKKVPYETIANEERALYKVNNNTQKTNHILMRLSLKQKALPIPVYNTKASAGQVILVNDEPELIVEYISAPFLNDVHGVIEIAGHSMYPKYPNGSRLAVKKLEHKKVIRPGEDYYVIDINYEGYVKRLYKSHDPELVLLRSYNEDHLQYPDFEMPWDMILAVFKVKAGIQLT
ncbi:MAG TPA: S24 family peptidase [Panacibacter sp.]|nr:S24 family peptidase [Panacibacter sp.]